MHAEDAKIAEKGSTDSVSSSALLASLARLAGRFQFTPPRVR